MRPDALAWLLVLLLLTSCAGTPPPPEVRTTPKAGEIATEVPPAPNLSVNRTPASGPASEPPNMDAAAPSQPPPPANASRRPLPPPKGRPPLEELLPPAFAAQGLVEVYVGIGETVRHDNLLEGQLRIYGEGNRTAAVKVAMVGDGRARLEVDGEPWPIMEAGEEHAERGVFIRVQRILSRN